MKKTITTSSGFKCSINEDVLDDMRLLEMIAELEENAMVLPRFLVMFLGEKQKEALYRKLYAALRDNGCFVLTDYFAESEELEEEYFHNQFYQRWLLRHEASFGQGYPILDNPHLTV